MDQARLRTNDGYARISHVAWRLMRRGLAVQMVILATVVLTYSAAHALTPTDGIQGVYSAQDRQSETSLYAILQQLPPPPGDMPVPQAWRNGVLLRVLVHRQGDMAGYQNPRLPVAITLAMPGNGHIAWRSNLILSG